MKRIHVWFAMFAVIVFLCAPCASAMQTTTIERTLNLMPPNPDSYQALFNMADSNNSQYSNANISVDPFCDASGVEGVRLSSMMLPSIVKHTNTVVVSGVITAKFDLPSGYIFKISGSDVYVPKQDYDWYQVNDTYEHYANDNTDFRIVTFHKFMSDEIMSGASESWWRIPYYYNINDASQQFNLNFYLYKITNPGKVNFTYYGATDRIIPKQEYQPSQVYAKTFTNIGFHNDSTTWYTQTNVVVPNQYTDTTYNQSYQFCWVNISAPVYANVSYCVVWHISHTAIENVYGLPGGFYTTASDLCKDDFYRTMTWYNNIFQDFDFDADVSIVFNIGMAGSTTGFRIAPPSYVDTDIDINPSMNKHSYGLYPDGYASDLHDTIFNDAPDWSAMSAPPPDSITWLAPSGVRLSATSSNVRIWRTDFGISSNSYTAWVLFKPILQDIGGVGYTTIEIDNTGFYAMRIRIHYMTMEIQRQDNTWCALRDPSGAVYTGIFNPITHSVGQSYYYIFRTDPDYFPNVVRVYRTVGFTFPHQTPEDYVGYFNTYDVGVSPLPTAITTRLRFQTTKGGLNVSTDFSAFGISNSNVRDGCEMYNWVASTQNIWDTTGNWSQHESMIPGDEVGSYEGNYHLQLDDKVESPTERIIYQSYNIDGGHPYNEAIGWSIWFKMANPFGYGNTTWYNTSAFVSFIIWGYRPDTLTWVDLADKSYSANNGDFYKYVSLVAPPSTIYYDRFLFAIYVEPYNMNPTYSAFPFVFPIPTTAWNGLPLKIAFDKSTIVYASEIDEYHFNVKIDNDKKTSSNYLTVMIPFRYTLTPTISPTITVYGVDSTDSPIPGKVWVTDGTQFHTDFVLFSIPSTQLGGTIRLEIVIQSFCEAYMFMYDYNNKFDLMPTTFGMDNSMVALNSMRIYVNGVFTNHIGYQPYRSVQFTDGEWVNTIDSITTQYITLVRVHFYKFNMDEPVLMYIAGYETTNLTAFKIEMGKFGEVYEAEEWYAMVASRSQSALHCIYEVGKWIYNGLKYIWNMIGSFIDMIIEFVVPLIEDIYYAIVNLCAFALAVLGFVMVTFIMLNFVNIWLLLPTQPIDVTIQHIHSSAKSYMGMAKSALSGVSGVANIFSTKLFKGKGGAE